ncbi:MAG: helix-turn-helix domain-containing protein [Candidatus Omnitrophica bacterium]|nr:helix-turn-helix domain-containing protein [Candidatus Omnitrophota bacterium]
MGKKRRMPEKEYRASRICRVLGNPTAYQIMKMLIIEGKMTPTGMSKKLGLTIASISKTLRNLRQIDLVRYETESYVKKYFIKDKAVVKIFNTLEKYVEKIKDKKF